MQGAKGREEREVQALERPQLALFRMSKSWSGVAEPRGGGPGGKEPGWRKRRCPGEALGTGGHGWSDADGVGDETLIAPGHSATIRWTGT